MASETEAMNFYTQKGCYTEVPRSVLESKTSLCRGLSLMDISLDRGGDCSTHWTRSRKWRDTESREWLGARTTTVKGVTQQHF